MYVLHDINLKYEDLTAQIDYIIITKAKIFFVECKNLIGNITVNERGEFIREYTYKNRKIKESIYSPIRQAERHIEIFKKIWNEKNTSLINKIASKNMDNFYKPLVVLSNSKSILNLKKCPKELKNQIIKSDLLVNYLKKDIENTDKDYYWNQKQMEKCAYNLINNYHQEIKRDYENEFRELIKKDTTIEKIKPNENIRENLIEFRKKKSKEKNIPAYYIFNNEELESLLKLAPKDLTELKNSKILSETKLKLHGKEIIDILNKN